MKRLAILAAVLIGLHLSAGTFVCNPGCLSKVASGVSIASNWKAIWAGAKKIHPKRGTKGKKT